MNPRLLLMGLLSLLGLQAGAAELGLDAPLPAVTASDHLGNQVDLRKDAGEGLVLVYFYPKADTPGCTKQACSLRDDMAKLKEAGVRIYGVSMDTVAAQKAFAEKFSLPFPLLADPEGKLVKAFGVPSMGKFAKRQAYLFKDGKLAWRDLSASTGDQAGDVLAAVAKLGGA